MLSSPATSAATSWTSFLDAKQRQPMAVHMHRNAAYLARCAQQTPPAEAMAPRAARLGTWCSRCTGHRSAAPSIPSPPPRPCAATLWNAARPRSDTKALAITHFSSYVPPPAFRFVHCRHCCKRLSGVAIPKRTPRSTFRNSPSTTRPSSTSFTSARPVNASYAPIKPSSPSPDSTLRLNHTNANSAAAYSSNDAPSNAHQSSHRARPL